MLEKLVGTIVLYALSFMLVVVWGISAGSDTLGDAEVLVGNIRRRCWPMVKISSGKFAIDVLALAVAAAIIVFGFKYIPHFHL